MNNKNTIKSDGSSFFRLRRVTWAVALSMVMTCYVQIVAAQSTTVCEFNANVNNYGIDGDMYANVPFANSDDWFENPAALPGTGIGIVGTTAATAKPPVQISAAAFKALLQSAGSVGGRNIEYEQRMAVPFGTVIPSPSGGANVMLDAVGARDNFSTSSTLDSSMFSGNGNKNGDNPTTWSIGVGNVPAKNDIIDAGGHIRRFYSAPGTPGDLWGYAFATTLATNGDSHVDFEVFRESPVFNALSGVVSNTGPAATGGHTAGSFNASGTVAAPGDLLVSIDYANGGTNPTASVRVWVNPTALGGGITSFAAYNALPGRVFEFTGVFDSGTGTNGYGYAEIRPLSSSTCLLYAKTNRTAPCRIPGTSWGNIFGSGANYQDSLECLQLVSVGINFSAFGLDLNPPSGPCFNLFGTLTVKTRSSGSFTASLKDYAGPYVFGNFAEVTAEAGADQILTCTNSSIQLQGSSMTPGASFSWTAGPGGNIVSGANTATPTVNAAGKYYLTVSNPQLATCTATDSVVVTANTTPPVVSCSAGSAITCTNATTTISVSATASSGNTITGYSWSPGGATGTSITVNNGDDYTVTVTQSNGCTATSTCAAVVDTCRPTVTATNNGPITCTNPSRTVSANATACTGKTIASYSWTGGATTASFSTSSAGAYTVTVVQSGNGCTASASTTLGVNNTNPSVSCSPAAVITCTNTSTTLDASVSASGSNSITGYLWSPGGATTASITVNGGDTYSVTVTQSNGCTASSSCAAVVDTCRPTVTATNNGPITCTNPSRTVSANATACTGKTIASYSWTGGATTASFSTSSAGAYTVTVVQSGNGCTASASTTLNSNNSNPTVSCSPASVITCTNTSTTLDASASASGSNSITGYVWSPGGATTASITVNDGDSYTVVVTQSNGCTASSSCSAVVDTCRPTVTATNNGPITCTNPSRTVSANATACTGKTIASYSWTGGATTASFSTSSAGAYTVTVVQSGNGCTASASTTLGLNNSNPTVSCSPAGTITCTNTSTTLDATAAATGPNTITGYSWSPGGATTAGITVNDGDTYTVTVTQSNGCTATSSCAAVVDTCRPTVTTTNNGPITCTNPSRTVSANATACTGKTIASYSWTGGATTASFSTSSAGAYTVTVVQSGNGCTASASTTLGTNNSNPTVSCSPAAVITCTNTSTTMNASATASGSNAITGYSWSPGGATTSSITVNNGDTYTVTVTQSNGCTATSSCAAVVDTCRPTVTAINNGPITCTNPSRTVSANAIACTGKTIASYSWNGGATTASFSTSSAGAYTVTVVQSGNGCTASASTTLGTNNSNPTVSCSPAAVITCTNTSTTMNASATASGSNAITGYSWSPGGATTSSITVNNGDTYTVTVTQSNGCTATSSCAAVVDTCRPTVTATNNGPITCTNPSRTVSANATACTGKTIASYSWTGGATTASFSTSSAGAYTVTVVQSGNGCTTSASTTLGLNNSNPTVSCSPAGTITCTNTSTTLNATATASGSNTITGYLWNPGGATTASISVTNSTVYTVTVTQSNGCTASSSCSATVDQVTPNCTISGPVTVACGTSGNNISANVTNAQPGATYAWSVVSGSGYTITSGNTATLTFTAGAGPAQFQLIVTNPNGCVSNCTVNVDASCGRFCTYTQGAYGNAGGVHCNGMTTPAFMTSLLSSGSLVIGAGTNTITFTSADVSCLISRLPGGGISSPLNGTATCQNPVGIAIRNGRFSNVLLAQTITLGLNLRINSGALAVQRITGRFLTTFASTGSGCSTTGTAIAGTGQTFAIPQSVISYLGANNTIGDLFSLANRALGRTYVPTTGTPTLSEINQAVDAINRGFDGCRMLGGFSNSAPASVKLQDGNGNDWTDALEAERIVAKAFPNPASESCTIEFAVADFTQGVTVDVYSLNGEKVAELFRGDLNGGENKRVQFNAATLASGIYVYRITAGDQVRYDKLIINR